MIIRGSPILRRLTIIGSTLLRALVIQRVYTDDGQLDETMAVKDGDVVCVPRGHHPCGAPHGFEMYYLNVMAGPLRKWRFVAAPEVEWILERDA